MKIYGRASLSEFLGDFVVYRRLSPADERLPGLETLIYLGDTRLLDGTAFANLCQAGGWQGLAFIAAESDEPPSMVEQGALLLANRWASLGDFERLCSQRGFGIDE